MAIAQFDLLAGEGTHLLPIDDDGANQFIVLDHRHRDHRSRTAVSRRRARGRARCVVGRVRHVACSNKAIEDAAGERLKRSTLEKERCKFLADVMQGRRMELVIGPAEKDSKLGLADARCVIQHCLEHRLQLARRTGNDLQHLARRGLLLQRLAEIVGALAQFVEQPRVLDRDHRLRGEILHQLDLLAGKRAYLLAVDHESADQLVVLEHRHAQCRSRSTQFGRRARSGARRIILDMGDGIGPGDLLKNAPRLRPKRSAAPQELVELARGV